MVKFALLALFLLIFTEIHCDKNEASGPEFDQGFEGVIHGINHFLDQAKNLVNELQPIISSLEENIVEERTESEESSHINNEKTKEKVSAKVDFVQSTWNTLKFMERGFEDSKDAIRKEFQEEEFDTDF